MVNLATYEQEVEIDVCTAQCFVVVFIRADGAAWNPFPVGIIYSLDVARRSYHMLLRMVAACELIVLGILVILPIFCRAYVDGSAAKQEVVNANAYLRSKT